MTQFAPITEMTLKRAYRVQQVPSHVSPAVLLAAQAATEGGLGGRMTYAQHDLLADADATLLAIADQRPNVDEIATLEIEHPSTPHVLRALAMLEIHAFDAARGHFEHAIAAVSLRTDKALRSDPNVSAKLRRAGRIELEQNRTEIARAMAKAMADYEARVAA